MPSFSTHATPNPNSIKITASEGAFVDEGMRTFRSAAEADGDPLGERLFALGGVEDVFLVPDFLTVTKSAGASWDLLLPKIESVLAEHFEAREA